jgi:hypothetical protein
MKTWKLKFAAKFAAAALVLASGTFMFDAGSAYAIDYGTNITKYDGIGALVEDNEAEPGMVQSQGWDLEGFSLKGKQLTIAGGYNFYTGKENMKAGDIFIDTNGDAIYSPNTIPNFDYNPGYKDVSNGLFKYDYVLDIDWANGSYKIVKLNDSSMLKDTEYGAQYNKPSNPWIYLNGGLESDTLYFERYGMASQGDTGFSGWDGDNNHFVATFDISAIDLSNGALFHNTMQCGNDNLIGQSAPVPEPSTVLLLGAGLLGAGLMRRRIRK